MMGMALAQAIIEYIHKNVQAKTLFSTHYHELTVLDETLPGLKNIHVGAVEKDGEVVFLHKMMDGPADKKLRHSCRQKLPDCQVLY